MNPIICEKYSVHLILLPIQPKMLHNMSSSTNDISEVGTFFLGNRFFMCVMNIVWIHSVLFYIFLWWKLWFETDLEIKTSSQFNNEYSIKTKIFLDLLCVIKNDKSCTFYEQSWKQETLNLFTSLFLERTCFELTIAWIKWKPDWYHWMLIVVWFYVLLIKLKL